MPPRAAPPAAGPPRGAPPAGAGAVAAGAAGAKSPRGDPAQTHVDDFNHNIKILTRDLAKAFPNDARVARTQKRIATAVEVVDPFVAVRVVGPYLFQYRAQIGRLLTDPGQAEFFLENDYDAELRASTNETKAAEVAYLIPKIKEHARSLAADELEDYKRLVVGLLSSYVAYLIAVKQGAAT